MDFNQYQEGARATRIQETGHRIIYPTLGLAGEAGEVVELVKKSLRPGVGLDEMEVAKEMGDVLWYLGALADDLGITLEMVAEINLKKLADRAKKGVISGSGSNR